MLARVVTWREAHDAARSRARGAWPGAPRARDRQGVEALCPGLSLAASLRGAIILSRGVHERVHTLSAEPAARPWARAPTSGLRASRRRFVRDAASEARSFVRDAASEARSFVRDDASEARCTSAIYITRRVRGTLHICHLHQARAITRGPRALHRCRFRAGAGYPSCVLSVWALLYCWC